MYASLPGTEVAYHKAGDLWMHYAKPAAVLSARPEEARTRRTAVTSISFQHDIYWRLSPRADRFTQFTVAEYLQKGRQFPACVIVFLRT